MGRLFALTSVPLVVVVVASWVITAAAEDTSEASKWWCVRVCAHVRVGGSAALSRGGSIPLL